jgi:hypothetical protein
VVLGSNSGTQTNTASLGLTVLTLDPYPIGNDKWRCRPPAAPRYLMGFFGPAAESAAGPNSPAAKGWEQSAGATDA